MLSTHAGANLNFCDSCLDDDDGGGGGETTFAANVTIQTEEESTSLTVDTDLEETIAWFDGSTGNVETVDDNLTMDLNPLESSLTVYLDDSIHNVIAASTPYHYNSTWFEVVAQDATDPKCEGESAWEAHFLDYDDSLIDPTGEHTVNVTWEWIIHDEGDGHRSWQEDYSKTAGNPVVHYGNKSWPFPSGSDIDHFHVYYNMSVDSRQVVGTNQFEIGPGTCPT